MSLDLAPDVETAVRRSAEQAGVSVEELLSRTFLPFTASDLPNSHEANTSAARVGSLLRQWQQEYGLPTRPDGKTHTLAEELFAQWDAEDAQRTLEEVEADQRLWEDYQQDHQSVTF